MTTTCSAHLTSAACRLAVCHETISVGASLLGLLTRDSHYVFTFTFEDTVYGGAAAVSGATSAAKAGTRPPPRPKSYFEIEPEHAPLLVGTISTVYQCHTSGVHLSCSMHYPRAMQCVRHGWHEHQNACIFNVTPPSLLTPTTEPYARCTVPGSTPRAAGR